MRLVYSRAAITTFSSSPGSMRAGRAGAQPLHTVLLGREPNAFKRIHQPRIGQYLLALIRRHRLDGVPAQNRPGVVAGARLGEGQALDGHNLLAILYGVAVLQLEAHGDLALGIKWPGVGYRQIICAA